MFLERYEDEEMYERIAKLKLNRHYLQNEHYVGLLIFQRKYIIPLLIENHVEEKDETGNWEIVKKRYCTQLSNSRARTVRPSI